MSLMTLPRFYVRHRLTGAPSSMVLYVTRRCNLACRTCFLPPGSDEPDLAFYRMLAVNLPRLMWLDIGGGEPFLRADLPEICGLFAASVLAIPTNGQDTGTIVPMVREIAASARTRVVISLSVDGSEPMHDAIRGAGTWRRAWSTFEELREIKGISLKVNTVVTSSNLESLPAFAAYVRARGADAHSLILLRGDPRDPSLRPPLPADLRRVGPQLLNELRSYGYAQGGLGGRLLWRYHQAAWSTSIATIEQERQVVPCLAGRNHLVIWPDRTAGPCELLPPVGCIEPAGLGPLIRGSAWRERCDFIAGGGCWCTHNCALLASLLFHPPSVIRMIASTAGAS